MRDTIDMAREAGIYHAFDSEGHWDGLTDVKLIERNSHPDDIVYGDKRTVEILKAFEALVRADAIADEREAVMGLLRGIDETETESADGWWETSTGAAFGAGRIAAIRARGNT